MLALDDLHLRQGAFSLHAHWQLPEGRKVAVMGPSGAGKSTLMNALAGFLPVDAGRVLWRGQDVTRLAPGRRPIAMLFQDGNLFPHLTAWQNVALGLRPSMRLSTDEQTRVVASLERVGLGGLADRKPAALSGGQQSRVALARLLVQRRPLLLLDEPFAALGPALKSDMLDLVAALAADMQATLLMVTHDPADARQIADDVVHVADGRADPPAPAAALLDNPPPALQAYLGPTDRR